MWHTKAGINCQPSSSPPKEKDLCAKCCISIFLLQWKIKLLQYSRIFLKVTDLTYTPATGSPGETVRCHSCSFSQNTKGTVLLKVLAWDKEVELKIKTKNKLSWWYFLVSALIKKKKRQQSNISSKMKSGCTQVKYSWEGGWDSTASCLFLSWPRSQNSALDQLCKEWVPRKRLSFHFIYPIWCKAMGFWLKYFNCFLSVTSGSC